jgi:hypothetical protein
VIYFVSGPGLTSSYQKKGASAEVKPFTNFTAFHDNLITRLKSLSHIHTDFDRRCKEAELRSTERLDGIKKQLDARWRQLDKFEASVSKIAEQKGSWRRKYHEKDSECEIYKVSCRPCPKGQPFT